MERLEITFSYDEGRERETLTRVNYFKRKTVILEIIKEFSIEIKIKVFNDS